MEPQLENRLPEVKAESQKTLETGFNSLNDSEHASGARTLDIEKTLNEAMFASEKLKVVHGPENPLRVSFPYKSKEFDLDPAKIKYAFEAIILDNMYVRLVNYDSEGQIVAELADSFYWLANSIVMKS